MFTNARLFTIDKFTNARFDCIRKNIFRTLILVATIQEQLLLESVHTANIWGVSNAVHPWARGHLGIDFDAHD